jgi:hypothetical protein
MSIGVDGKSHSGGLFPSASSFYMDLDSRFLLDLERKKNHLSSIEKEGERLALSCTKTPFAILRNTAIQTTTPRDRTLVAATTGAPLYQLSTAPPFRIAKRFETKALIVPFTVATTEVVFIGRISIAASAIDRRSSTVPTYLWLDAPPAIANARNQLVMLLIPTFPIILAGLAAKSGNVIVFVFVAAVGTAHLGIGRLSIHDGIRRVFGGTPAPRMASYASVVLA